MQHLIASYLFQNKYCALPGIGTLSLTAGKAATDLLDWAPDPAILKLVKTWPGNVASARANAMGLQPDTDFESVVRDYARENPSAVKLPLL